MVRRAHGSCFLSVIEESTILQTSTRCKRYHKEIAMAHRVRYDDNKLVGMLSDVHSDVDDLEPMCPGSDNEFLYPDSDDER